MSAAAAETVVEDVDATSLPKKGKKKKLIILIAAAVLLAGGAGGGAMVWKKKRAATAAAEAAEDASTPATSTRLADFFVSQCQVVECFGAQFSSGRRHACQNRNRISSALCIRS